ncbi:nucleotidyltransferase domain-containing protein [bacterium]|nr:nucleotidyltransferase domain-containing protein [bacterium]
MTSAVSPVLNELRQGLAQLYGTRLKGLYVFGSYARDEASRDSDLDVLIVLDRVAAYRAEIKRTSLLVAELSLASGVSLSRVFTSESEWLNGETPFLLNVREEAVPA